MFINTFSRRSPASILTVFVSILSLFYSLQIDLTAQSASFEDISFSKGTFFGTSNNDSYLLHVAVDAQGYVYGTGLCTNIPASLGAYNTQCNGQFDVMVFKMDPTLSKLIWATYIGGTENDAGGSIAVSASGEVFVSGYTFSPNFPTTNAADRKYLTNGQVAIYSLKLSADGGRLLYSRVLGNGAPVQQQSQNASKGAFVSLNPKGEAFVLSYTPSGAPYSITTNAFQRTGAGAFDLVFSKLDSLGTIVYSTFIGGSGGDVARDICYAKGKVYVCGATASPNYPRSTGRSPIGYDAFVTVIDDLAVPRVRRSYVYGGSGNDFGTSLTYDLHANRILVTGTAEYGNLPTTKVLQPTQVNGGFVASLDTGLSRINFLTMLGNAITPTSIAARSNSCMYIAGYVIGSVPTTFNAFQPTPRGDIDGTMISLDSLGSSVRYGTYIGGSAPDYSAAKVLIYEKGCVVRIIFGITTHSQNFPSSLDSFQPQKLNGSEDQGALVLFSTINDTKFSMSAKSCSRDYSFHIEPACAPLEILWDFGDGTPLIKSSTQVQHRYSQPGRYRLRVQLVYQKPDTVSMTRDVLIAGPIGVNAGPDQTICTPGTKVILRASGARFYRWSPAKLFADSTLAQQEIAPKTTTSYVVFGIDSSGCESVDTVVVRVGELLSIKDVDTSTCEGSAISIRINTTSMVRWLAGTGMSTTTGPSVILLPAKTETYTAIISDGLCTDSTRIAIKVFPRPHIIMPVQSTICFGHQVSIQAQAYGLNTGDTVGMKVQWLPRTNVTNSTSLRPTFYPSKSTTYQLHVTTGNGCTRVDSTRIIVQNPNPLSVIGDTVICSGSGIRLWASGATKYRWTPTTGLSDPTIANPLCTVRKMTKYTVVATRGTCVDSASMVVRVGAAVTVVALGDTTVCEYDRVSLRVLKPDPKLTYAWSPAADFENAVGETVYLRTSTTKSYTVTASNSSGCISTDAVRVTINNKVQVEIEQDSIGCENEVTSLRVRSTHDTATRFAFFPNDGEFNPFTKVYVIPKASTKTYVVRATQGNCVGSQVVSTQVKSSPIFKLTSDTTVCVRSSLYLSATSNDPSLRYRWSDGSASHASIVGSVEMPFICTVPLDSSMTFVVSVSKDGCEISKQIKVSVRPPEAAIFPKNVTICPGERVALTVNCATAQSVRWEPEQGLSNSFSASVVASPSVSTTYRISLVDSLGCIQSRYVIVAVKSQTSIQLLLNSTYVKTGEKVALTVRANSSLPILTDLSFDIACDAGIFAPDDSTEHEIVNGIRLMHVNVGQLFMDQSEREIAIVRGNTMLESSSSSVLTIESERVVSASCALVRKSPGILAVTSCYYAGRNIQLVDSLRAHVLPNPVGQIGQLQLETNELGPCALTLFDQTAAKVRDWTIDHSTNSSIHTLNFDGISSGVYMLSIRSGLRQMTLKVDRMN